MKTFPFYSQLDQMDCGPSCLRMISRYYGRSYSLQELRKLSSITREGVSLMGISDAAEAIGFRTLGVKISFNKLENEVPLPCIVHWDQNHFIVVYKIRKKKVFVADPAQGLVTYQADEFLQHWLSTEDNGSSAGLALLLEPNVEFYNQDSELESQPKAIPYLLGYLKPHRKLVIQLLAGLFLGSIIQLALPFFTQSIVDVGIQLRSVNFIYLILIGQLMLFIGRTTIEFIRRWILLHLSTRINISIISDFLIKLMKLPLSFFDQKLMGDLLRRIEDHSRVEHFLSASSLNVLFSAFNLMIFGVVLLLYNVPIFLTFFSLSTGYVLYVLMFMKKRKELDYKRFRQNSRNQSGIIEIIQGMAEIKLNNCEKRKRWEWERIQAALFQVSLRGLRLQQIQDGGSAFINEMKNLVVTVMAARAVIDGEMTLGMMLSVQYIIGQLNSPINEFVNFSRVFQDAKISLERIGEVLAMNEEPSSSVLVSLKGGNDLHIDGLSFGYEGPKARQVLDNLSLTIPKGKTTAIVGSSGSGKTTLMKLLLKFYEPTNGKILLGKTDLQKIGADDWRKKCAAVLQDGFVFSDTIANNISLSADEMDIERVSHAAEVANIHEFVESLPLGYNTKIGRDGVGLSQGQKQRLLIARAVYKDPEYLFFDEATSALDANNEKAITENLKKVFQDKTVLVIAHRLSTVKNADNIIVLENGRIIEQGTHTRLTIGKGKYYELVKNQLELGN